MVDAENDNYYAFVMRKKTGTTRYFKFDLPKVNEGEMDETYKVKKVVLDACDIKECFDCEYHDFIQGTCFHKWKIYSTEGFFATSSQKPDLRVIDVNEKKQKLVVDFVALGALDEPEMIDFYKDVCYYGDAQGNVYTLEF